MSFLRRILYILLYLSIYSTISGALAAQQLTLEISAEKEITEQLKDSLNFRKDFENFQSLKSEVDTLSLNIQRLGFIESELVELQRKNDSTYRSIYYLGKQYTEIKIFYESSSFSERELSKISTEVQSTYFIISFFELTSVMQQLNKQKARMGDPFAKLQLSNIFVTSSKTLEATLKVIEGGQRTIDKIIVKGYEKFPKSFIKYYAGIKTEKSFDRDKIVEQNDVLDNLGFVNSIKSPEVLFELDSTSVYLYLEKRNYNLFDGILGFATNEATNKLELNGYLDLELNNNLNFGEQFQLNYKADGNEQRNFRVRASMPYLFKSPMGVELELRIFKRDSSFTTTDQQARVSYQLNPKSTAYVGYKTYESSNLLNAQVPGTTIEDYESRFLLLGVGFQSGQDSNIFPTKTAFMIETEIGDRDNGMESLDQFKLQGRVSHIFNLNKANSVYLANETSFLSSDNYLTNELFRFGGINSIRGFNENSIDASLFSVLNIEYRYSFRDSLYVHSITDLGYFENKVFNQSEELYSFGFGIGLLSQAGLFRFNIANGNREGQNFKFSNTKIHLSLTSRF